MRYESKFAKIMRGLGFVIGVAMMIMGSFITFIPMPQISSTISSIGTSLIDSGMEIEYNDEAIIAPDFIPYAKLGGYAKYELYSPQHIRYVSYFCPNNQAISHRDSYCATCHPATTLKHFQEGLHAPGLIRNTLKYVRYVTDDGKKVVYQRVL